LAPGFNGDNLLPPGPRSSGAGTPPASALEEVTGLELAAVGGLSSADASGAALGDGFGFAPG
jgi:hypothetical protein